MSNEASTQQVDLLIEGELSIYRADELKRALIEPLKENMRLVVNLAAVTELDTCGLQLLMLAKRTAAKLGGELQLVAHSPAVLEVFELLNVAAFFGDQLHLPRCAHHQGLRGPVQPGPCGDLHPCGGHALGRISDGDQTIARSV